MRNADLTIDEDEAADLLIEIEKQLKKRQWGEAIRLEVEEGIDKRLLKILKKELRIKEEDIFHINGPLDLTFLMKLYSLQGFDHLRNPRYTPQPSQRLNRTESIFTQIGKGDILLHHPYHSFDPIVEFVSQAATDPHVLAIKQTLYRVSSNSPIIASLALAAEIGKQVSV
jgi:polyphosphate kinase